jgi:hypothetical protein
MVYSSATSWGPWFLYTGKVHVEFWQRIPGQGENTGYAAFLKTRGGSWSSGKYPLVNEYSSGNLPFSSLIHLLKRVIFYGYVPSPEGI